MNKSKYHNHKKVFLIFTTLSLIVGLSYFYAAEKRKVQLSNMVKYHTKMIKSGSISSLVELGKMYEKGEGVKKDLTKAQELFKKAINFNEYIDEIYPSYSDYDSNDDDSNVASKKETQLNNIRSNVKITEQENHKSGSIAQKKPKPKYVPYVKAKKKITNNSKSKNPFKRVVLVDKKIDPKSNKSVAIMDATKKNKPIKKINSKKLANKTQTTKRKNKNKSDVTTYKKSAIIIKKQKLQAKRSPTLYEERPDYENELGIFEDEELQDSDDEVIIPVQTNTVKKQTIGSNFISNPCATESAKYIAKCRRANRKK